MEHTAKAEVMQGIQAEYDNLVEERVAFQAAGMEAKVAEWDHKIHLCEANMQYPKTSIAEIAESLGIAGLNDAVQARNAKATEAIDKARELARDALGDALNAKRISESKMWALIEENDYRFADNPLAKAQAIKLMLPKLSGTAKNILSHTLREIEGKLANEQVSPDLEAYVRVVGIESYKENDNPPMDVLKQIADAVKSGLFTALFVAFPMVGRVKQVDPIVFGVVCDGRKRMWGMDTVALLRFNRDVSVEDLKTLDFGEMYHITEWV